MMSVLDLFAQAASSALKESHVPAKVVEITDLRLLRWIVVDSPKRLRVVVEPIGPGRFEGRLEVWRDARRAEFSRWETHAQAVIVTADGYVGEPAVLPRSKTRSRTPTRMTARCSTGPRSQP